MPDAYLWPSFIDGCMPSELLDSFQIKFFQVLPMSLIVGWRLDLGKG
jgi:hypothetical protein